MAVVITDYTGSGSNISCTNSSSSSSNRLFTLINASLNEKKKWGKLVTDVGATYC